MLSKTNELASVIKELRDAASVLTDTADWLASTFLLADACEPSVQTRNFEEVRAILVEKSRDGHSAEVRELLQKYGASKLSEINPADYDALIKDAEVI